MSKVDFDRVCGRLYGLIKACMSDSPAGNDAVPFEQACATRQESQRSRIRSVLHLLQYFMYARSKGSGTSARMCRLV